jgi:hypothetical protein
VSCVRIGFVLTHWIGLDLDSRMARELSPAEHLDEYLEVGIAGSRDWDISYNPNPPQFLSAKTGQAIGSAFSQRSAFGTSSFLDCSRGSDQREQ